MANNLKPRRSRVQSTLLQSKSKNADTINELIQSIQTKPRFTKLVEFSVECLGNLCDTEGAAQEMFDHGVLPIVQDCLRINPFHESIRVAVNKCAESMCQSVVLCEAAADSGYAENLVFSLNNNQEVTTHISSLCTLDAMIEFEGARVSKSVESFLSFSGICALESALRENQDQEILFTRTAIVLSKLLGRDVTIAKRIASENRWMLDAIVQGLTRFPKNPEFCKGVLDLMETIVNFDKDWLEEVRENHGVDLIIGAMEGNPDDADILDLGASMLDVLAREDDMTSAMADLMNSVSLEVDDSTRLEDIRVALAKALGPILKVSNLMMAGNNMGVFLEHSGVQLVYKVVDLCLRIHSDGEPNGSIGPRLIESACRSYARACNSSKRANELIEIGALDQVLSVMRNYYKLPDTISDAYLALRSIVKHNRDAAVIIVDNAFIEFFVQFLKTNGSNLRVYKASFQLIKVLGENSTAGDRIAGGGIMEFLLDLIALSKDNPDMLIPALRCVEALASISQACGDVFAKLGGVKLFIKMIKDKKESSVEVLPILNLVREASSNSKGIRKELKTHNISKLLNQLIMKFPDDYDVGRVAGSIIGLLTTEDDVVEILERVSAQSTKMRMASGFQKDQIAGQQLRDLRMLSELADMEHLVDVLSKHSATAIASEAMKLAIGDAEAMHSGQAKMQANLIAASSLAMSKLCLEGEDLWADLTLDEFGRLFQVGGEIKKSTEFGQLIGEATCSVLKNHPEYSTKMGEHMGNIVNVGLKYREDPIVVDGLLSIMHRYTKDHKTGNVGVLVHSDVHAFLKVVLSNERQPENVHLGALNVCQLMAQDNAGQEAIKTSGMPEIFKDIISFRGLTGTSNTILRKAQDALETVSTEFKVEQLVASIVAADEAIICKELPEDKGALVESLVSSLVKLESVVSTPSSLAEFRAHKGVSCLVRCFHSVCHNRQKLPEDGALVIRALIRSVEQLIGSDSEEMDKTFNNLGTLSAVIASAASSVDLGIAKVKFLEAVLKTSDISFDNDCFELVSRIIDMAGEASTNEAELGMIFSILSKFLLLELENQNDSIANVMLSKNAHLIISASITKEKTILETLSVLRDFVHFPNATRVVVQTKVIDDMKRIIKGYIQGNSDGKKQAIAVNIISLMLSDLESVEKLVLSGALEDIIIPAMNVLKTREDVQINGLRAFREVSRLPHLRSDLLDIGVESRTRELLKRFRTNSEVQLIGRELLDFLSYENNPTWLIEVVDKLTSEVESEKSSTNYELFENLEGALQSLYTLSRKPEFTDMLISNEVPALSVRAMDSLLAINHSSTGESTKLPRVSGSSAKRMRHNTPSSVGSFDVPKLTLFTGSLAEIKQSAVTSVLGFLYEICGSDIASQKLPLASIGNLLTLVFASPNAALRLKYAENAMNLVCARLNTVDGPILTHTLLENGAIVCILRILSEFISSQSLIDSSYDSLFSLCIYANEPMVVGRLLLKENGLSVFSLPLKCGSDLHQLKAVNALLAITECREVLDSMPDFFISTLFRIFKSSCNIELSSSSLQLLARLEGSVNWIPILQKENVAEVLSFVEFGTGRLLYSQLTFYAALVSADPQYMLEGDAKSKIECLKESLSNDVDICTLCDSILAHLNPHTNTDWVVKRLAKIAMAIGKRSGNEEALSTQLIRQVNTICSLFKTAKEELIAAGISQVLLDAISSCSSGLHEGETKNCAVMAAWECSKLFTPDAIVSVSAATAILEAASVADFSTAREAISLVSQLISQEKGCLEQFNSLFLVAKIVRLARIHPQIALKAIQIIGEVATDNPDDISLALISEKGDEYLLQELQCSSVDIDVDRMLQVLETLRMISGSRAISDALSRHGLLPKLKAVLLSVPGNADIITGVCKVASNLEPDAANVSNELMGAIATGMMNQKDNIIVVEAVSEFIRGLTDNVSTHGSMLTYGIPCILEHAIQLHPDNVVIQQSAVVSLTKLSPENNYEWYLRRLEVLSCKFLEKTDSTLMVEIGTILNVLSQLEDKLKASSLNIRCFLYKGLDAFSSAQLFELVHVKSLVKLLESVSSPSQLRKELSAMRVSTILRSSSEGSLAYFQTAVKLALQVDLCNDPSGSGVMASSAAALLVRDDINDALSVDIMTIVTNVATLAPLNYSATALVTAITASSHSAIGEKCIPISFKSIESILTSPESSTSFANCGLMEALVSCFDGGHCSTSTIVTGLNILILLSRYSTVAFRSDTIMLMASTMKTMLTTFKSDSAVLAKVVAALEHMARNDDTRFVLLQSDILLEDVISCNPDNIRLKASAARLSTLLEPENNIGWVIASLNTAISTLESADINNSFILEHIVQEIIERASSISTISKKRRDLCVNAGTIDSATRALKALTAVPISDLVNHARATCFQVLLSFMDNDDIIDRLSPGMLHAILCSLKSVSSENVLMQGIKLADDAISARPKLGKDMATEFSNVAAIIACLAELHPNVKKIALRLLAGLCKDYGSDELFMSLAASGGCELVLRNIVRFPELLGIVNSLISRSFGLDVLIDANIVIELQDVIATHYDNERIQAEAFLCLVGLAKGHPSVFARSQIGMIIVNALDAPATGLVMNYVVSLIAALSRYENTRSILLDSNIIDNLSNVKATFTNPDVSYDDICTLYSLENNLDWYINCALKLSKTPPNSVTFLELIFKLKQIVSLQDSSQLNLLNAQVLAQNALSFFSRCEGLVGESITSGVDVAVNLLNMSGGILSPFVEPMSPGVAIIMYFKAECTESATTARDLVQAVNLAMASNSKLTDRLSSSEVGILARIGVTHSLSLTHVLEALDLMAISNPQMVQSQLCVCCETISAPLLFLANESHFYSSLSCLSKLERSDVIYKTLYAGGITEKLITVLKESSADELVVTNAFTVFSRLACYSSDQYSDILLDLVPLLEAALMKHCSSEVCMESVAWFVDILARSDETSVLVHSNVSKLITDVMESHVYSQMIQDLGKHIIIRLSSKNDLDGAVSNLKAVCSAIVKNSSAVSQPVPRLSGALNSILELVSDPDTVGEVSVKGAPKAVIQALNITCSHLFADKIIVNVIGKILPLFTGLDGCNVISPDSVDQLLSLTNDQSNNRQLSAAVAKIAASVVAKCNSQNYSGLIDVLRQCDPSETETVASVMFALNHMATIGDGASSTLVGMADMGLIPLVLHVSDRLNDASVATEMTSLIDTISSSGSLIPLLKSNGVLGILPSIMGKHVSNSTIQISCIRILSRLTTDPEDFELLLSSNIPSIAMRAVVQTHTTSDGLLLYASTTRLFEVLSVNSSFIQQLIDAGSILFLKEMLGPLGPDNTTRSLATHALRKVYPEFEVEIVLDRITASGMYLDASEPLDPIFSSNTEAHNRDEVGYGDFVLHKSELQTACSSLEADLMQLSLFSQDSETTGFLPKLKAEVKLGVTLSVLSGLDSAIDWSTCITRAYTLLVSITGLDAVPQYIQPSSLAMLVSTVYPPKDELYVANVMDTASKMAGEKKSAAILAWGLGPLLHVANRFADNSRIQMSAMVILTSTEVNARTDSILDDRQSHHLLLAALMHPDIELVLSSLNAIISLAGCEKFSSSLRTANVIPMLVDLAATSSNLLVAVTAVEAITSLCRSVDIVADQLIEIDIASDIVLLLQHTSPDLANACAKFLEIIASHSSLRMYCLNSSLSTTDIISTNPALMAAFSTSNNTEMLVEQLLKCSESISIDEVDSLYLLNNILLEIRETAETDELRLALIDHGATAALSQLLSTLSFSGIPLIYFRSAFTTLQTLQKHDLEDNIYLFTGTSVVETLFECAIATPHDTKFASSVLSMFSSESIVAHNLCSNDLLCRITELGIKFGNFDMVQSKSVKLICELLSIDGSVKLDINGYAMIVQLANNPDGELDALIAIAGISKVFSGNAQSHADYFLEAGVISVLLRKLELFPEVSESAIQAICDSSNESILENALATADVNVVALLNTVLEDNTDNLSICRATTGIMIVLASLSPFVRTNMLDSGSADIVAGVSRYYPDIGGQLLLDELQLENNTKWLANYIGTLIARREMKALAQQLNRVSDMQLESLDHDAKISLAKGLFAILEPCECLDIALLESAQQSLHRLGGNVKLYTQLTPESLFSMITGDLASHTACDDLALWSAELSEQSRFSILLATPIVAKALLNMCYTYPDSPSVRKNVLKTISHVFSNHSDVALECLHKDEALKLYTAELAENPHSDLLRVVSSLQLSEVSDTIAKSELMNAVADNMRLTLGNAELQELSLISLMTLAQSCRQVPLVRVPFRDILVNHESSVSILLKTAELLHILVKSEPNRQFILFQELSTLLSGVVTQYGDIYPNISKSVTDSLALISGENNPDWVLQKLALLYETVSLTASHVKKEETAYSILDSICCIHDVVLTQSYKKTSQIYLNVEQEGSDSECDRFLSACADSMVSWLLVVAENLKPCNIRDDSVKAAILVLSMICPWNPQYLRDLSVSALVVMMDIAQRSPDNIVIPQTCLQIAVLLSRSSPMELIRLGMQTQIMSICHDFPDNSIIEAPSLEAIGYLATADSESVVPEFLQHEGPNMLVEFLTSQTNAKFTASGLYATSRFLLHRPSWDAFEHADIKRAILFSIHKFPRDIHVQKAGASCILSLEGLLFPDVEILVKSFEFYEDDELILESLVTKLSAMSQVTENCIRMINHNVARIVSKAVAAFPGNSLIVDRGMLCLGYLRPETNVSWMVGRCVEIISLRGITDVALEDLGEELSQYLSIFSDFSSDEAKVEALNLSHIDSILHGSLAFASALPNSLAMSTLTKSTVELTTAVHGDLINFFGPNDIGQLIVNAYDSPDAASIILSSAVEIAPDIMSSEVVGDVVKIFERNGGNPIVVKSAISLLSEFSSINKEKYRTMLGECNGRSVLLHNLKQETDQDNVRNVLVTLNDTSGDLTMDTVIVQNSGVQALLHVMGNNSDNSDIQQLGLDLFTGMVSNTAVSPELVKNSLPSIFEIMTIHHDKLPIFKTGLDLVQNVGISYVVSELIDGQMLELIDSSQLLFTEIPKLQTLCNDITEEVISWEIQELQGVAESADILQDANAGFFDLAHSVLKQDKGRGHAKTAVIALIEALTGAGDNIMKLKGQGALAVVITRIFNEKDLLLDLDSELLIKMFQFVSHLSRNDKIRKKLEKRGIMNSLVPLIHTFLHNEDMLLLTIQCINGFENSNDLWKFFLVDNTIPALCSAIDSTLNNEKFIISAVHLLGILCRFQSVKDEVNTCCGVEIIVKCMRFWEECAEVLSGCLFMLANCTFNHDDTILVMLMEDGLHQVISAVQLFTGESMVVEPAAMVVINCSFDRENARELCVKLGLGKALVDSMLRNLADDALLSVCLSVIGILAFDTDNISKLVEDGVIQAMVAIMIAHIDNDTIVKRSVEVFTNLTDRSISKDVRKKFLEEGALQAFVKVLVRYHDSPDVVMGCVNSLNNLARGERNTSMTIKSGGPKGIGMILSSCYYDSELVLSCSVLLLSLCKNARLIHKLSNEVSLLAGIIACISEQTTEEAPLTNLCVVLRLMAKDEERCSYLGKHGVVDVLLKDLDRWTGESNVNCSVALIETLDSLTRSEWNACEIAECGTVFLENALNKFPSHSNLKEATLTCLHNMTVFHSAANLVGVSNVDSTLVNIMTASSSRVLVLRCVYILLHLARSGQSNQDKLMTKGVNIAMRAMMEKYDHDDEIVGTCEQCINLMIELRVMRVREVSAIGRTILNEQKDEVVQKKKMPSHMRNMLVSGALFKLHLDRGGPFKRILQTNSDMTKLIVTDPHNKSVSKSYQVVLMSKVVRGRESTALSRRKKLTKKYICPNEDCALVIMLGPKPLSLEARDFIERENWMEALLALMHFSALPDEDDFAITANPVLGQSITTATSRSGRFSSVSDQAAGIPSTRHSSNSLAVPQSEARHRRSNRNRSHIA